MRIGNMDFPDPLLEAQKKGSLVIFAGAGVSMPPPSNFPNFDDLAHEVAGGVLQRDKGEPVDRFLGRLVDREVRVHERVQKILSNPDSAPNSLHSNLLRLFETPARMRLVTTNFDLHFTGVARSLFDTVEVETFSAPALPLGDSFNGLVYLHGSIDKPSERLVLTDADFGRAYLTEGWATQFLQRLFAKYVVMFIGYSHNDPVMNYLARGLPPESGSPRRFALIPEGDNDRWRYLGITPITYPLTKDENQDSAVGVSLARWVELSRAGALEQEQKIKSIAERPVPIDLEELDYIESILRDASTTRFFTRYAKSTDWLRWVESKGFLKRLFEPRPVAEEIDRELASWFAATFVCEHPGDALAVVRRGGQRLSPLLWTAIAQHIHAKKPRPTPEILGKWIPVLIGSRPTSGTHNFLDYMLHDSTFPDNETTCLLLFEHLTRPTILLKEDFWGAAEDESKREKVEIELGTEGTHYWLLESWQKRLRPNLENLADKLMFIVASNLQQAYLLLRASGREGATGDPLSWSRGMIESSAQGSPENGLGVLIDVACELLEWNIANRPRRADFWIDTWASSGCRLLRRLAIFGVAKSSHWSPDKKIGWVLENDLLYGYGYKHEVFLVLQSAYPDASEPSRIAILERAVKGFRADIDDNTKDYEIFNLLHWLTQVAPDCSRASARFAEIASKHPEFGPRDHPDMDSWIGPVRVGWESPSTDGELLSKTPEEQLEFLISYKPEHPFGPSREGLIENLKKAVAHRYDWGVALAHSLKRRELSQPDLWKAVVDGWRQTDLTAGQWEETLGFLLETDQVLTFVVYEASNLLEYGIAKSSNQIPDSCLDSAVRLSEKLWSVCTSSDEGKQEKAKDWLFVAINWPAGILLEFFLHLLSRLRKQSGDQWKEIGLEYKQFLESVLGGSSYAAELGRIVLASQLHFIFSLDEKWAVGNVVPLFDWTADSRRALQAWLGFLGWGRWTHGLLPHLMPYYEKAFPALQSEFGESRRKFCEHLAGIACFSSMDPIKNGWLNRFLLAVGLEERVMWASSLAAMLGQMKEPASQSAWDNWIQAYWQNRIEGLPVALDAAEVGEMVQWSVHLQSAFPEVVKKICNSPAPKLEHSFIYRQLFESKLPSRHPSSAAKLLLYLLRNESVLPYDIDPVADTVGQLAASDIDKKDVLRICDELARLGYGGAKMLRDSIDATGEEHGQRNAAQ